MQLYSLTEVTQPGSERATFKPSAARIFHWAASEERSFLNAVLEMQPFPFHPLCIHPPNVIINLRHPRVTNKLLGAEVTN